VSAGSMSILGRLGVKGFFGISKDVASGSLFIVFYLLNVLSGCPFAL